MKRSKFLGVCEFQDSNPNTHLAEVFWTENTGEMEFKLVELSSKSRFFSTYRPEISQSENVSEKKMGRYCGKCGTWISDGNRACFMCEMISKAKKMTD